LRVSTGLIPLKFAESKATGLTISRNDAMQQTEQVFAVAAGQSVANL
jgi:hypothetical protein